MQYTIVVEAETPAELADAIRSLAVSLDAHRSGQPEVVVEQLPEPELPRRLTRSEALKFYPTQAAALRAGHTIDRRG